jgi:GNAT superfamily N-acetyltransferase
LEQEFEIKATLKVRMPTIDDAAALHTYCFPSMKLKEVEDQLNSDLAEMEDGKMVRLVADAGGYAVGNIKLSVDEDSGASVNLSDIVVAGPFRGIDVADRLMQVLSDVAQSKGIPVISAHVHRDEARVIDTFKKWGFSEREIITLEKHLG